jgi:hypothetical protein
LPSYQIQPSRSAIDSGAPVPFSFGIGDSLPSR